MTVLRSRKILPTVAPKPSQPFVPENVAIEPVTPAKSSELDPSSNNTTPSSSSLAQNRGHLEIGFGSGGGSIMVSECGIVRRLSARLVKKTGIENVEVVSAKRKKVNGEFDSRNLGRQPSDLKLEAARSGEISDTVIGQPIVHDMGDEKEKLEFGASVTKETCTVKTESYGRRKRKSSMEVEELGSDDEVEKGILSLRSGKRIVKREMRDDIGCTGNLFERSVNSEGGVVSGGETLSESMSVAKPEEDENGCWKEEGKYIKEEEGNGKFVTETPLTNGSAPSNFKSHDSKLSLGDPNHDANNFTTASLKGVVKDEGGIAIETGVKTRRRASIEEKGKLILGVGPSSSNNAIDTAELKVDNINESSASGVEHTASNEALQDGVQVRDTNVTVNDARNVHRERFRRFARRNASRFAHFSSQDELGRHAREVAGRETPLPALDSGIEDWPGPFSTAMKIIKDRGGNSYGERQSAFTNKSEAIELKWTPKNQESCKHQKQTPSLIDLCLSVLSKNADAITSLDFVPDVLRHKICCYLCDSRRMDGHFLELLVHGTPTEIRVRECSWLSEDLFTKAFEGCDSSRLMVLQFDQCGSCMPDHALHTALARSPNSLAALSTISLKGAYRLTDAGLGLLVSAAPSLKSIDISQCPMLTAEGVCCLASSLGFVLRELYLNNCHGIEAMLILPALQKLEKLEVLSVAGIQTVSDDFVRKFVSTNGCRMKELVLADCVELTDFSVKFIGDTCSDLQAIDLTNLGKLTDISIGHLANGCRALQTLKLCRNAFSDEAIAAYLDLRGESLKDLALNNITQLLNVFQVSNHTALSLARNCRNLRSLDLSWCRNLTNEALGLIVDSCVFLEALKLFGCTQVTNAFVDGHSNPRVKLIGLKMTPLLKNIEVPDFLVGPLRYSSAYV